jgi:hypothetical protein
MTGEAGSGDHALVEAAWPANHRVIDIRVAELNQLFNAIDPAPFRKRDLAPNAEEFIVGWAQEQAADVSLAMQVHLGHSDRLEEDTVVLRDAVQQFFHQRAEASRRAVRLLLRNGRTSLMIGLVFLGASVGVSDLLAWWFRGGIAQILREGCLIGGWVAMWRPLEIFLYDWWPIRAEARVFDRLAAMPVQVSRDVATR